MDPLKILIVEDDLQTAHEIQACAEEAGHQVTGIARDAKGAMKLVKNDPPDIAVIDIKLGKLPEAGIAIAQEILSQHWIPFIYLSSYSDPATVEKARKTFPSAYLLKPFRPQELLIQISVAHTNFFNQSRNINHQTMNQNNFYLPFDNGHEQITTRDILYLEAKGACVNVYLMNRIGPKMIGMTLGNLSQYFTTPNFFRLSRSLFINMDHRKRIERTHIYLGDEKVVVVEISEANRKELLKKLKVVRTK
ncbi:hypothetical protein DYBT9275_04431 [Dyadobacter sp. CECT 9275]|uniref:Response regulator transcription factor n=1 Tax=Dyadobacter helix TaxID=2822344 RepID=A0A916NDM5_9BACT|nr:response regulator [Dyadobacter sp. CECT 9275]CAG5009138.1 hypothetical protein DYBT9275_04431 [Dyadobacter sp. CECT 9275]